MTDEDAKTEIIAKFDNLHGVDCHCGGDKGCSNQDIVWTGRYGPHGRAVEQMVSEGYCGRLVGHGDSQMIVRLCPPL